MHLLRGRRSSVVYTESFKKRTDNVHQDMSRDMRFPKCGVLTSVDSDEPVQPSVKRRNSKWCSVSSLTVIEYSSD